MVDVPHKRYNRGPRDYIFYVLLLFGLPVLFRYLVLYLGRPFKFYAVILQYVPGYLFAYILVYGGEDISGHQFQYKFVGLGANLRGEVLQGDGRIYLEFPLRRRNDRDLDFFLNGFNF